MTYYVGLVWESTRSGNSWWKVCYSVRRVNVTATLIVSSAIEVDQLCSACFALKVEKRRVLRPSQLVLGEGGRGGPGGGTHKRG